MQVNLTEILIALIGIVFTGVIIPLVRAVFVWLKEKTQNEALKSAIEEAQVVADGVVASLGANLVEDLKKKNEDGRLTTEEAKQVMETAIGQFLCDLSERSLEVIESNADDVAEFISNLIEQRLAAYKKGVQ
jgi:tryptophanyl-tRNA synthetase